MNGYVGDPGYCWKGMSRCSLLEVEGRILIGELFKEQYVDG